MNKEILCTLGPSSMGPEVIRRLDELGVGLFRINLSHTKAEDVEKVIRQIRSHTSKPICLDTEGAQIRTGNFAAAEVVLEKDSLVTIPEEPVPGDARQFNFYPEGIGPQLRAGDRISIDFNAVLVQVVRREGGKLILKVINGGKIGRNKAVTVERPIDLPVMTPKDLQALAIGRKMGVRHVALSFANHASDVDEVRKHCDPDTFVIAKIECRNGLVHLDDISAKADALLIDRGDLSREEPIERIPWLQKYIIRQAKKARKKVYVATNLLESMTVSPGPTRAEVNDVINTLIDGADGLVLAAETAIGKDPVGCAEMMVRLIREFEKGFDFSRIYRHAPVFWFTGLSGSGKTTVAAGIQALLEKSGRSVLVLDGDEIRKYFHKDLGFAREEILENNERIASLCASRRAEFDVILVPIISPYRVSRQAARELLPGSFYEVFFDANLECVMGRDVKGLYAKAKRNELPDLIGFSPASPYEPPQKPDFVIKTGSQTAGESIKAFYRFVCSKMKENDSC
ncbi:MAG: adenylyl-sulfate kinase [Candidatus Omnitrophica bacterium]|nr:adenylyl-sulfate kinase [Candidatus Omnitrophota bacterium]